MNDEPRKATITCTTDCLLYALSADNFRELIGTVGSLLEKERGSIYPKGRPAGMSVGQAGDAKSALLGANGTGSHLVSNSPGANSAAQAQYEKDAANEPAVAWDHLDHKSGKILGKGSFGTVKLVQNKLNKKTYALKSVWKKQIVETGQQGHIMSEKKVMTHLRHPFLIRL